MVDCEIGRIFVHDFITFSHYYLGSTVAKVLKFFLMVRKQYIYYVISVLTGRKH